MEVRKIFEEGGRNLSELGKAAKVSDLIRSKAKVQKILYAERKACSNYEVAVCRKAADGKLKCRFLFGLAGFEVAGRHGQFVEIGEESVHGSGAERRAFQATYFLPLFGGWNSLTSPAAFCRSWTALESSS